MEIVSAPQVIDLESLLTPIGGEIPPPPDDEQPISEETAPRRNPSGASLRRSQIWDDIKEARRADDNLSQGSWQRELKIADWRKVIELTVAALTTQTKDLQIAVWLVEALIKQHGFAGLRDGVKLVRGFHEKFWETFYPEKDDDDDLEARANSLESMNKQAAFAIKEVALTSGGLNFFKYEESKSFDIPDNFDALDFSEQERFRALQEQANEEKRATGADWRRAKAATTRRFYEEIFLTIAETINEFALLERLVDEKFGSQTPGFGALKKSLDDVRHTVEKITLEKREADPDKADDEPAQNDDVAADARSGDESPELSNGNSRFSTGGAIRSRGEALKELSKVALFFRQTEPHSPVSYLINRAVRFGNMPLESVLKELIKDEAVLSGIKETLGIASEGEPAAD